MGDPVRIARVRDRLSEPLNNAEPTIGLGEQHDPAIGTDPPAVKSGGDLLAADGWKAERQKVIVGHGGRGLPRSQQRVGFQQPNPTPDQKLTLLPPPSIRPRHEYDGLAPRRDDPTPARVRAVRDQHYGRQTLGYSPVAYNDQPYAVDR